MNLRTPRFMAIFTGLVFCFAGCNCNNSAQQQQQEQQVQQQAVVSCGPACRIPDCDLSHNILDVKRDTQIYSNWCWAACGQMCMNYLGYDISQCRQVNDEFDVSQCCLPECAGSATQCSSSLLCNKAAWPRFDRYHFGVIVQDGQPLSFCDIQNQIACNNTPFAFSWYFNGSGAHVMVATGFSTVVKNDTSQWVYINNPLQPKPNDATSDAQVIIAYCEYISGSYYTHGRDYYNLSNNNSITH